MSRACQQGFKTFPLEQTCYIACPSEYTNVKREGLKKRAFMLFSLMKVELYIGLRYLLSKKRNAMLSLISMISFLGIGLGVTALLVVLSVMNGAEEEFKSKILGANAHILVLSNARRFTDYKDVIDKIEKVPHVKAAAPFIYNEVMLTSELGASSGVMIYGVDSASAAKVTKVANSMVMGSFDAMADHNRAVPGIVIGRQLSKDLNVIPGDRVTLIAPFAELTPMGISPKIRVLEVVGVFETGMWQFDSKFVYMDLKTAQKMFLMEGAVHGLEIAVDDLERVTKIAVALRRMLGDGYRVRTWIQMNRDLFGAFEMEKRAMFVILTMIVLVASFNIIGTLIMFVDEKKKDIAILKSMGLRRGRVMSIFVIAGTFIGAAGTLFGVICGWVLCMLLHLGIIRIPLNAEVYQIDHLPVAMSPWIFAAVALTAFAISVLSTLYPSYKAAAASPAEGLRYE